MTKKKPTQYSKKTADGGFKVIVRRLNGKTWDEPVNGVEVGQIVELLQQFSEILVAVMLAGESSVPK